MKHFFQSALLLLALFLPATAMAHNFEVDGIYYKINGKNATVTYRGAYSYSYSNEYTGDVTIPATVTYNGTTYSVTVIGNSAFSGCSGLTSINIPNSVTSIGNSAFWGCSGLTSINIPNSVTTIGGGAFQGCSGLTSIIVASGNTEYDSRNGCNAIIETASNTLIAGCQNTSIPNSVTAIGNYAFYGCSGLTSIDIPNSVTSIGDWAFYGCTGLTSIDIPNSVTTIGNSAFSGCTGLTSINIPNSVTTIGNSAFSGCTGLTSINIPNSVTTIGNSAFYGCTGLTSINIPNSVTTIGNVAFSGCTGLTSINIPNSVTFIGHDAFSGTAWFDNQPNGLVYTGLIAYKYKGIMPSGSSITLRDGTLGIAGNAFYQCSGLTSIDIPNSVTYIGDIAFAGCSGLSSIDIPNSVTTIGTDAFDDCTNLTSVIIPNSVTSIGDGAFYGCTGLTSITIYNSIISTSMFEECTGLTSVSIGNSVTSIGDGAFYNCSGLTSINIPNSVITIGNNAFCFCRGLSSITIPNSVTTIGVNAFGECSSLTSINISNSVTTIGGGAFQGCSGLTSITIPNSVTAIGDYAFLGCNSLNDVYSYITELSNVSMGDYVFDWTVEGEFDLDTLFSGRTLYVPYGTSADYQNDSKWSDFFGSIVEMDPVMASSITLDRSAAVIIDNETLQLTATVLPGHTTVKTLNWASSNAAVATVDENGLVTAHSVGTATITASTTDGSNLSASCVVTVKSLSADNAFAMPDSEVLHGEAVVIPVKMNNSEEIMAFQTDIYLPEGFTVMTDENNEMMVTPSSRLTDDHMLMTERLADGAVRVLCYTPSAQAIEGNEGDLFYITVLAPGDAAGDYAIYLRNSRLTNSDYEELRLPEAGAVLTVKTFIPGDANDSHAVNVADIVTTAQYVMQRNPSPFVFEAADMNGDGEVSVTDIMLIARLILYPATEAPRHAPAIGGNNDRMSAEGITLATGETRRVSIDLDNEADYSAFQLDMTLPAGMTASNFMLTDRDGNHALDVETLSNGKVRVLCYSPAIEAIKGNSGAVLTLDVTATGIVDGCIGVDGIELVTADCQTVRPGAFTIAVNNVTAVDEVAAGKTVTGIDYYNLAGQRVSEPASGVTLVVTTYSDGTRTTAKVIR